MNGRGVNRAPGTVSGLLAIARLSSSLAGGASVGVEGGTPLHCDTSVGRGAQQRHLGRPERIGLQLECLASTPSRLRPEGGGGGGGAQARGFRLATSILIRALTMQSIHTVHAGLDA